MLSNYRKQGPTTKHFPNMGTQHRVSFFGALEEKKGTKPDIKEHHLISISGLKIIFSSNLCVCECVHAHTWECES